jgi:hypothetical protein
LDDLNIEISSMSQEVIIAYSKFAPVLSSLVTGIAVVRLSHDLILKRGTNVLASEGESMSYIMKGFKSYGSPEFTTTSTSNTPPHTSASKVI